jgi:pyruvate/2-oxoglutarate dehydrogenase complex dihydrolipoamide dehydrogenase (E3) component
LKDVTNEIAPADEYNRALVEQTHPPQWINPTPGGRYNLVAIGGGTAGIISALGTAGLKGRAALIERHLLGGDCLNYGCVPSKALVRAGRAAFQAVHSTEFGVRPCGPALHFPAVMERMRRLRAQIGRHDSAWRFTGMGVDVFLGEAAFTGPRTVVVDGQTLEFQRAVIATGARAALPAIEGLADVGFRTNETIFSLAQLPARLIVIGGGPVGCELAQAFRRLGSEVHLLTRNQQLLPKEDPAAAHVVRGQFEREGIRIYCGATVARAERVGHGKSLVVETPSGQEKLFADEILVAVGRQPNVEGLGLEAAGVKFGPRGIEVNDRLQTANKAIFAAGDVCSDYKFTHAADAMARLCIQNALFLGRRKVSSLVIPRCTYTDPEVAHIGLTPAEAAAHGIELESYREDFADVDRAVLDGEEQGFAVLHVKRGSSRVVGATVVAAHAGEMIGEISLLMTQRIKPSALASTIHCYPTQAEVFKRLGDQIRRRQLTPRVARILEKWLAWSRGA